MPIYIYFNHSRETHFKETYVYFGYKTRYVCGEFLILICQKKIEDNTDLMLFPI